MRAVVTGGAGFVGSHLCERLLRDDVEVTCVDNFVTSSQRNVEHLTGDPRFTLLSADICQPYDVDGDVDVVFHFASPASPVDYLKLPVETMLVGSHGTEHTLDLARRRSAAFVLASTSEAYGDPLVHPQPETYWGNVNPVGPRAVYDEAKRFAESLTMAYRRAYGLRTSILRIFNTHGPRMRANDGRCVPAFIQQALTGEPITVHGDGSQTRSIQYVDDLIDGVLRLAASGHPGPVNIGNPTEVSMLELATTIRDLCASRSEIVFAPRPVDDPNVRRPDISLARTVLGWEPHVTLDEGLKRTISWFDAQLPARTAS